LTLDAAREELARIASTEQSAVSLSAYQLAADPDEVDLDLTAALLHWIVATRAEEVKRESGGVGPDGAVLVFLPGWHEISQLRDMLDLDPRFGKDVLVLPLHSMVPPAEQKRVFKRPPAGVKKIVLATNIAETAVTIDDVVFVVDSGRLKEKSYDPHTGVSTLQATWISRASAQQRRGRAGRVRPGECYRLYSSARMASFADFQLPEMQRSPLEELCLQVRMLAEASSLGGDRGGAAAAVGTGEGSTAAFLALAPEPPVPRAIKHAVTLLQNIGALKEDESLTRLGRHLGEMPVHPRVGKMLLYATLLGVLDPVLTVACAAAYRSPFVVSTDGGREAGESRQARLLRRGGRRLRPPRRLARVRGMGVEPFGGRRRRREAVHTATLFKRRHSEHAQRYEAAAHNGAHESRSHRVHPRSFKKRRRRRSGARRAGGGDVPSDRPIAGPAAGRRGGGGRARGGGRRLLSRRCAARR